MMHNDMLPPFVHPDRENCRGCTTFTEINGTMECVDLISYQGGTPKHAPCFKFHPTFFEAVADHRRLVENMGKEHPKAQQAMEKLVALTPPWMRDEIGALADEMGQKVSKLLDPAGWVE